MFVRVVWVQGKVRPGMPRACVGQSVLRAILANGWQKECGRTRLLRELLRSCRGHEATCVFAGVRDCS